MSTRLLVHIRNQWIGVLALFIALATGGTYAAAQIGSDDIERNAVHSKHIKNGQVHSADLADGAVDSQAVEDGSLLGEDFAPGQLPAGEPGPPGPSGATNVVVRSAYFNTGAGQVDCNAGEVATGGGAGADIVGTMYVARSEPVPGSGVPTGWQATIRSRIDGSPASGTVYVVCASP
jgi:hypothetical protein